MNRRSPGLFLSKAIEGFLQYKQAEALSPRTIESYAHDLKLWLEYQKDGDVAKVTTPNLRAYGMRIYQMSCRDRNGAFPG